MLFEIDIKENELLEKDPQTMQLLLKDNSSKGNIIWATNDYQAKGSAYEYFSPITLESITGEHGTTIRPRVSKSKSEKEFRSRDKGEVFTPAWVCNKQNNLIDDAALGYSGAFNSEIDRGWRTSLDKVVFPTPTGMTWQDYVCSTRLEITCGEAPYLVSRYDALTGELIPVEDRIGILDRKLRVVSENVAEPKEWVIWAKKAFQSTYAFEWQGDSLLLARENLLITLKEFYGVAFNKDATKTACRQIAEIISWNVWQMDALKGVIPGSCHEDVIKTESLFDTEEKVVECKGCEKNDIYSHNGIYCMIKDWSTGEIVRFVDTLKA